MELILDHISRNGVLQFMILTIIMGGGAAFMAGRSLANGWRGIGRLLVYMIPFTVGIRFLHFALFQGQLASLSHFVLHGLIVSGFALIGYRMRRTQQMTTQYPWLYERSGPMSWRNKK
jgi:hypothetical protein